MQMGDCYEQSRSFSRTGPLTRLSCGSVGNGSSVISFSKD